MIRMTGAVVQNELRLKSLELFQLCAERGSLQAAADEAGLSVSTVSHHLRSLENSLGAELFDHGRRPMVLTPKGQLFLKNIAGAMQLLRKAQAEASAGSLSETRYLRIGSIEDFDSDVVPELAVNLARLMPDCHFLYHTASSHEIIEKIRNRHLDIGITTSPPDRLHDLSDRPLLRDPFVVAVPKTTAHSVTDIVQGKCALPFLQFSSDLIIARQIEAQMRRLRVSLPGKIECANTQTLLAMVAAGAGWTITTPLLYSRARRFQPKLAIHPFPGRGFSRTLSIVTTPEFPGSVLEVLDQNIRQSLGAHILDPCQQEMPWLTERLALIA